MKLSNFLLTVSLLTLHQFMFSQEWRSYNASDAVNALQIYHGNVWVASGSGLSQINISSGQKTIWTTLNSDLKDYGCNVMTIDSNGTVWMAVRGELKSPLIRFDGNNFETMWDINGKEIRNVLDIQTAPDGKVWIYANTMPMSLYLYDQNQFTSIPVPSANLAYHRNSQANLGIDDQSHVWIVFTDINTDDNIVGEYDGTQWILHDVSVIGEEPMGEDAWARDHIGNIYLLEKSPGSAILLKYDGTTWSKITLPSIASETRYINQAIYVDSENHIWLLLENNTILQYDGNNWTTLDLKTLGFTNGHPEEIFLDPANHWWMMYDQYEANYELIYLYHYDGANPQQVDLSNSSIPSNEVGFMVIDELNNKWMRSNYGLLKFNGNDWTLMQPTNPDYYLTPLGSNRNGGVWLYPDGGLIQFDGLTFTKTIIPDADGTQYPIFGYAVDQKGRVILSSGHSTNMVVYDRGIISYLDNPVIEGSGGMMDYPHSLATDAGGQIYGLGNNVYRYKSDSIWATIPLWDEFLYAYGIVIAPDSQIWVSDYFNDHHNFYIYDGIQWNPFNSQIPLNSFPQWDQEGNPWFKTDQGLCKYVDDNWQCYNQANSPIIPDRIVNFAIDSSKNIWITQKNGGLLVFNEGQISNIEGHDYAFLSGKIYRDLNHNGALDDSDTPLAYQRELLLPDSTITFSNLSGDYHMPSIPGDHVVKYLPRPNWHIDNTPASYNVTVGYEPISDLNFALAPDQEQVDLRIFLNLGFPRCSTRSNYSISFSNYGTSTEEGNIIFIKDPDTGLGDMNPAPNFISGDTLIWAYSDLIPFETNQILIQIILPGVAKSPVEFSGYIDRLVNDDYQRIDSFHNTQVIRCSYDPNDKIARTVRSAGNGKSYLDDPLMYTIRFQNTGNDTAFNIVIRDTLDADLDLNTLEIIGSSHPYEAFLKPDRTLEFRFLNILLADSTTNELASHGFVSYSIKANSEAVSPTIIENTAHIYFDFNDAIQTNTAINQLIEFGTGIYNERKLISVIRAYPNPTSDVVIIEALSFVIGMINYSIVDMHGQVLQKGLIQQGESKQISLAALPAGIYLLNATDGDGTQVVMLVKG